MIWLSRKGWLSLFMGFLQRIISKKKPAGQQVTSTEEFMRLRALDSFMTALFRGDHFVARSEYLEKLEEYRELLDWFQALQSRNMLDDYCRKNGTSASEISGIIIRFKNLSDLVDFQNDQYIKSQMIAEKDYLDTILRECDPKIVLDEDQRRVVLTDEDYCLVVAGAGAGKTTTVAAKVKYLVDKQGIDPKQILVISFTNKAVNELKQRIIGELHIECPIATFHSTGNAVIHKQNQDKLNIVDGNKLYYVVQDYFRGSILKNETAVNDLILFFASYFDTPYEGADLNEFFNHIAKSNFTTMRSELDEFKHKVIDTRTKKSVTIQSEIMRSAQEVEIANFLYLNGVEYEYEPMYRYDILFARKPYTPDFRIWQGDKEAYLEHFGITEDGQNNRFSSDELDAYKKAVRDKIMLHRQHGTKLLYTFSSYKDRRPLIEHLQEQLEAAGFELHPRSNKEVMEKLVISEENRYIRKLVALICRFITNFKTNGFTEDEFNRMYHSTQNVRTRLFLNICNDCYIEYERYLRENQAVDFQDMINESARILREVKEMKQKLDFRYIIVDEYQDISRQRFDLVSALHDVTAAKIIAVGDDWQSIYAFSGSDITLFTKFKEKMGYAALLKIVRTYRNSQEVIDIAGNFIQKNGEQIQKDLVSNKHVEDPVIVYTYDSKRKDPKGDNRSGVNYAIAHAIETVLAQIIEYNRVEGKPADSSILLLGRFGFDGDRLEKSGLFEYITRGSRIRSVKYPKLNITFMTAHSSKGLGYDNVIVVNGRNETYGFPSKIENDPVLSFVIKEDLSIKHAEERRLFYVAMTRTKNRVFFIAPEQNPSEFLLELKHDYKSVVLKGNWNEDPTTVPTFKKACPMCGYPMQFRYKTAYGLRLHICTNEPEICSFMTNNPAAGKLSIIKCDQCRDGYLIVKPGKDKTKFMLGCTNYKKDGTGCNRLMAPKYYYEYIHITNTQPAPPVVIPKGYDIAPKTTEVPSSSTGVQAAIIHIPQFNPIEFRGIDLNTVIGKILQTLSSISTKKYYGITMLVDVLRGSQNKRIREDRLNVVDGYGELANVSRTDVEFLIKWLIDNGFILKTKGLYPVLHPTYNGEHYGEVITRQKLQALKKKLENTESTLAE